MLPFQTEDFDPTDATLIRRAHEALIVNRSPDAAVIGLEHEGVRAFLAKTAQNRWLLTGYQV